MRNLVDIQIDSPYKSKGVYADLPKRMAKCTPDMHWALKSIEIDVEEEGGEFLLSDLYRSYERQYQANLDYVNKKKKAYSPPAGGSMHEAGRAFDTVVNKLNMKLSKFWEIARTYGVTPIISRPDVRISECWHYDKMGSHEIVYSYYKKGKANNLKPYRAMAMSGILAIDEYIKGFDLPKTFIQSGIIRLGLDIGNMDGIIGRKTKTALATLDINPEMPERDIYAEIDFLLKEKFPEEYV